MRAVIRKGVEMILKDDVNIPTCGDNEVLVRVKAGAINPVDYKLRWPLTGPVVGIDFSGVVEKLGSRWKMRSMEQRKVVWQK